MHILLQAHTFSKLISLSTTWTVSTTTLQQIPFTRELLYGAHIKTRTFWWSSCWSFLLCWCSLWRRSVILTSNSSSSSPSYWTKWRWIRQRRQSWLGRWRSRGCFVNDVGAYVQQPNGKHSHSLLAMLKTKNRHRCVESQPKISKVTPRQTAKIIMVYIQQRFLT